MGQKAIFESLDTIKLFFFLILQLTINFETKALQEPFCRLADISGGTGPGVAPVESLLSGGPRLAWKLAELEHQPPEGRVRSARLSTALWTAGSRRGANSFS